MKKNRLLLIFSVVSTLFCLTGCNKEFIPESTGDFIAPEDVTFQDDFKNYKTINEYSPYAQHSSPSSGDVNILVIPTTFSDIPNPDKKIITDLEKAFNGTSSQTGWQSLHTFFKAASYGNLNVRAEIVKEYYKINLTADQMNSSSASVTANAVDNAVSWYKNRYRSDCTKFDADKDGYIDTVMLIYAAEDYSKHKYSDANASNLWAYCYWTQNDANKSSPNPNTFFWASYDFMYGSRYLSVDAHTFIHEFGHCMGLDDYYNYDHNSTDFPAGGFDMQSHNVGDHNGFSKMSFGWSKPYVVNGNCEITLERTALKENNYIIIPAGGYSNWNKSPFDEYLLLEYYSPKGMNQFDSEHITYPSYPRGPRENGIKLTHIDTRMIAYRSSYSGYNVKGYVDNLISGSYYYEVAATNSTPGAGTSRISKLVEARDYKEIQVISKTKEDKFSKGEYLTAKDLFKEGDSFSMSEFKSLFFHEGKMNGVDTNGNYESLGFSFEVIKMTDSYCTIRFSRD